MKAGAHLVVQPLRGIDQRWRPAPNAAAVVRDMRWNQKDGWEDSGGYREATNPDPETGNSPFVGQGTIESLHWFAQHNGARQWLVWEDSAGRLRAFNGSTAPAVPWTHLEDVRGNLFDAAGRTRTIIATPWQGTQAQAWGGRLYLVNGYDEPLVFDGVKCDRAGWSERPSQPYATAVSGVSTTLNNFGFGTGQKLCARKYRVSFLNERGQESELSPPSNPMVVDTAAAPAGARRFGLVSIPLGPSECVARRVYATQDYLDGDGDYTDTGLGEIYFFHSEVQDNETEQFEDHVPDPLLGSAVDDLDFGPWPTGGKYLAVFKNTLFIATDDGLFFSAPGQPEVIPSDNFIPMGDDDMGPPTGMRPTKNALLLFKRKGVYLVKGEPLTGFSAHTLTRDQGNDAPNALAELPGLGMVMVNGNGVHLIEGALENTGTVTAIRRLSTTVPDEVADFASAALIAAHGAVYHRDKEYWLSVPRLGSNVNNRVLVFHYEIGEWSWRPDFPINCMLETRDHRGLLYFGSGSTTTLKRGLLVYSPGFPDKGGTAIQPLYETGDIDWGNGFTAAVPVHLAVRCIGHGNNDLNLNYRINRQVVAVRPAVMGTDQQDHTGRFPVFGTAVWGTDRWHRMRPVEVVFDLTGVTEGPARAISFSLSPALRHLQLLGIDVAVTPGAERDILPYSADRGDAGQLS